MAEGQGDVYVRRNVFEARLSRIEELNIKTASELREVRYELQRINAKFNSIGMFYSVAIMAFWIVLAVTVSTILLSAAALALRKRFQPSLTREDIERIAKTEVAKHLKGGE
ncbi:MAG: hypothetical protein IJR63_12000 [Synergistaceae bacterium]|nr:hypothetical protein [Synergistaceae bacterium]